MKLIVTRPEPLASRTAEKLRALGHEVTVSPLMKIVDTGNEIPAGPFTAMAVSSINALRVMATRSDFAQIRQLPIFTVGDASAKKASELGFDPVISASGTASDLAELILQQAISRPKHDASIIYACGVDRTPELERKLTTSGVRYGCWEAYKVEIVGQLTKKSENWLCNNDPVGVLLYSARSAQSLVRAIDKVDAPYHIDNIQLFVLSNAIENTLPAHLSQRCKVAMRPDEAHLFQLIDPVHLP